MRFPKTLTSLAFGLWIIASATNADAGLRTPTAVSAEAMASSRITVTWNDSNVNCTGFNVERSLKPTTGFKLVAKVNGGTLRSYSDGGLAAATTYYYRVRAVYGATLSSRSAVADATTWPLNVAPTRTATPVPTATRTPVPTATATALPAATRTTTPLPTATHTATPVATVTVNPTATQTATAVPTATATPIPTATATAMATRTATPVPTATATRTVTPVPTATATRTATPVPTATVTATRTPTPVPTATTVAAFDPVLIGFVPSLGSTMDVAATATTAFTASDPFGLAKVDVSVPAAPAADGTANRSFTGAHVAVGGTRAVVSGTEAGVAKVLVLDVGSNDVAVLGEVATGATMLDVAINAAGTVAVTAMGASGIWVFDLSNPAAPVRRGVYDTAGTAFAVALDDAGGLAYVADGSGGLKVVSLANLAAPTLVGSVAITGIQRDIALQGNVAYLADQMGRLVTVDVATPSAPRQLGAVVIGRYTFNVAVEGNRAVVHTADSVAYLEVLDVSSPANPVLQGNVAVDAAGGIKGIAVAGGRAFVANATQGLKIYDLGTSPSLKGVAKDDFAAAHMAAAPGISVVTGTDVPSNTARIQVVDTSDPTLPHVVGELATTVVPAGILDVAINAAGTTAVTAMGTSGIWVLDLGNPAAPVRRGVYDTTGIAYAVALNDSGSLAYVADGNGGIKVVSLANPSAPALLGSLAMTGVQRDIAVQGGMAYVADQMGRLVVVDVATPSAPREIGSLLMGRYTFNVAVQGALAIVHSADSTAYVDVVDITTPASPTLRGSVAVDTAGGIKGLAVDGGRVFVANGAQGMKIYSLANPSTPSLAGNGYTIGAAMDVAVENGMAETADAASTVSVIDLFAR